MGKSITCRNYSIYRASTEMRFAFIQTIIIMVCVLLPACHKSEEGGHEEHQEVQHHKIVVTSPVVKDVTITQQYVCQIHSCRHIEVRALETGYLEAIVVKEGQVVQQNDSMFKVVPTLYQARLDADVAEERLAQVEYDNTKKLTEQKIVSPQELLLAEARLAKAKAKVKLAKAELNFANVRAPFPGIIDRLHCQQGSLVVEGDILTTLSDNSVMWVYFNVPEARYFEYKAGLEKEKTDLKVELMLANHTKFPQIGAISAIEAEFNNVTGNISFRADFSNPDRLLRHGQTGTVLISHTVKDAVVIPQRATFEILAKKYAFVVGEDELAHQREIVIKNEMDDIYVIESGLEVNEKIILEGLRQVRDGEKVEYEFLAPEEVLGHLKFHAE